MHVLYMSTIKSNKYSLNQVFGQVHFQQKGFLVSYFDIITMFIEISVFNVNSVDLGG